MEGFIALLAIVVLIIFILPLILSWNTNSKVSILNNEVKSLQRLINELKHKLEASAVYKPTDLPLSPSPSGIKPTEEEKPEIITPTIIQEEVKPKSEKLIPEEEVGQSSLEDLLKDQEDEIHEIPEIPESYIEEKEVEIIPEKSMTNQPPTYKSPQSKTNFEQFIGEKLISLVGIAILVLGIFFTVKWAINRNLMTDAGKVLTGLGAGTLLIAIAHKLSKNYRTFSSILAGGGVAVLYFSMYQCYHSYHLISQTAAFIAMIGITLFAVLLSILYDKKELAVIALIGGFASPFFVSNGEGNYKILFTYLLILNVGMFILANFKKWSLLNTIAYLLTTLMFSLWLWHNYNFSVEQARGGFIFSSLFFLIFFGSNIIYNIRQQQKFAAIEISMLLGNCFYYLGVGLYFLHHIADGKYKGIFVILLAVFHFIFAYWFYKKQQVDKTLIYLLIALVLTFVSLTGPIQLDGSYITLFWAAEALILYWLSTKSGIQIMKNTALILVALTLISLVLDWRNIYFGVQVNKLNLIFNKAFVTGSVVFISFAGLYQLIRKDNSTEAIMWGSMLLSHCKHIGEGIMVTLAYVIGLLEIKYQAYTITRSSHYTEMSIGIYHYLFLCILLMIGLRKHLGSVKRNVIASIAGISLFFYPFVNIAIGETRNEYLFKGLNSMLFNTHVFIPLFALIIVALFVKFVLKNYGSAHPTFNFSAWFITFIVCYILSTEAIHLWVVLAYEPGFSISEPKQKAIKVALPIIWSLVSLILMWLGMSYRIKILRIISLCLFSLIIAKLFFYDISNVSQGGKIAAFIILGVILLIVSFMYQKIKGLFVDEPNDAK